MDHEFEAGLTVEGRGERAVMGMAWWNDEDQGNGVGIKGSGEGKKVGYGLGIANAVAVRGCEPGK